MADEHGVSASRLYWEYKGGFFNVKGVSIPVAVTVFPSEQYQAPRSWTERAYPNLIYYNQVDRGHCRLGRAAAVHRGAARSVPRPALAGGRHEPKRALSRQPTSGRSGSSFPADAVQDLRRRIAAARWPSTELVADRSQGVQLQVLQALARYWLNEYDFGGSRRA